MERIFIGAEREPGTFSGMGVVTEWRWRGMDGADEVEAESRSA